MTHVEHQQSGRFLCAYSDAYILVKGTITVPDTSAVQTAANNPNKKLIFKNCPPFTYLHEENKHKQIMLKTLMQ